MGFCGFFDLGLRGQWNADNTDFAGLCGFFVCHSKKSAFHWSSHFIIQKYILTVLKKAVLL
jgi:hypothetical protein